MAKTKTKKELEQTFNLGVPANVAKQKIEVPTNTSSVRPTGTGGTGVYRNPKTGGVSGVELPDGRTFFGLTPDEAQEIIDRENRKMATPAGALEMSEIARQERNIQEQQKAIEGLGAAVQPSADLDTGDTATTTALSAAAIGGGIAGGAALGAKGGALAGTALAPATGGVSLAVAPVVGAVIGGIVGGLSVLIGKITLDKKQATKEAYKVFTISSGIRYTQLLNVANSGAAPPASVMDVYNKNLANIKLSRDKLKKLTKGKVGRQLSSAMDELIAVESWLDNEPAYRNTLALAIANPNPNLIYSVPAEATEE